MKEVNKEFDAKMQKTIDVVMSDFASVRAGRANAAVLDKITVDYYGAATPLNQVAAISSPDPRSLMIQPWDATLLKAIEKAIQTSDLGINPQNDGKVIRLAFPQLTEERRKELTKQVRKYGEAGKVAIRNIRRDAMDKFKAMEKKSEITEDDRKDYEKELQDITEKRCKQIDELTAKKIAKSVVCSSLLKAAISAADANWGRVLCAIGYTDAQFDIDKIDVDLSSKEGSIAVCRNGSGVPFDEDEAKKILTPDEVTVNVNCNIGTACATAWGCDLTCDYVKINADYRT